MDKSPSVTKALVILGALPVLSCLIISLIGWLLFGWGACRNSCPLEWSYEWWFDMIEDWRSGSLNEPR